MSVIKKHISTLLIASLLISPLANARTRHHHSVKRSLTVPRAFRVIAKECHVPAKHLYAIALTETETKLKNGHSSPWTWTINYRGKSYFYPDRQSLYAAANKLLRHKHRLFDVGIMQVNWRWHHHRVSSLWALTSPETNIRVACEIYKEGYRVRGNWVDAAGYYHNPSFSKDTRSYVRRYRKKLASIHY